ncbi:MAG TPA: MFS transporter [Chloroflexia bacterium]|nr:MFS transporter [Chloroflexia bacterium]
MRQENSSPDFEGAAGSVYAGRHGFERPPDSSLSIKETQISRPNEIPIEKKSRIRPGSTFSAFRYRNYRIFWTGGAVSNLGNWMQTVGQNWLVISLTNSPFMLGLVSFIGNSPVLFLSLYGGVVADRNSRRTVLLVTQNIMALLVMFMAILTFFNIINIWIVLAIALGVGIVQAFNSPAYQTIIVDLVGKDDLMNAIAMNSLQFNLTRIIGPSIAGVLVSVVGVAACFFFNSLSFMAVIVALMLVKLPPASPRPGKRSALLEIKESLGYIKTHSDIAGLILITIAFNLFIFPYLTLLPVFARDVFHSGAGDYGLLLSAVGVGALFGSLIVANASSRLKRHSRFFSGSTLSLLIALFGLALSREIVLSLLVLALCGASMVMANSTLNTLVQTSVPDEMRGRIVSVWTICTMGLMPVGNLISGTVAQGLGAPAAIMINGVAFLLVLVTTVVRFPKVREF